MNADALKAKLLAALQKGAFKEARRIVERSREAESLEMPIALFHGMALIGDEDWPVAEAFLEKVVALYPTQSLLCFNLAVAKEHLDKIDEAIILYQKSFFLGAPESLVGPAHLSLSTLYRKKGYFDQAIDEARRSLAHGLPEAAGRNCLGLALWKAGNLEEAAEAFRRATELTPERTLYWLNRANLASDRGLFAEAWPFFAKARAGEDRPLARRDEAMARLYAGDYEKGWELFEARLEGPGAFQPPAKIKRWHGQPLAGKTLLIVAEPGFGNTIQFCRYGALLEKQGAKLIWRVPESLVRLLKGQVPGAVVSDEAPLPRAAFYLPLLSLPLATGAIPPCSSAPYLKPPSEGPALPAGKGRRFAFAYRGAQTNERDAERSLPLSCLAPLFEACPNDRFFGFGIDPADQDEKSRWPNVIDLLPAARDFADTAFFLSQMDGVISVDTALAHLGGALGVPTRLLLAYAPDWRWGPRGEKTQWYDCVTLLRQKNWGDWGETVTSLIAEYSPKS